MNDKNKIIDILNNASCIDPADCIFGLMDYDEQYNSICKATEPPKDAYMDTEHCPFCEMLAEMLEKEVHDD